jgi:hypothetical protein
VAAAWTIAAAGGRVNNPIAAYHLLFDGGASYRGPPEFTSNLVSPILRFTHRPFQSKNLIVVTRLPSNPIKVEVWTQFCDWHRFYIWGSSRSSNHAGV